MTNFITRPGKLSCLLCCLLALFTAKFSAAKEVNQYDSFCGAADQTQHFSSRPVSQMSNEELYLAAEAMRDGKMSAQQRVINHYWMSQSERNTVRGTSALRHVVRAGIVNFWKFKKQQQQTQAALQKEALGEEALASRWGQYDVDVSQDSISLSVNFNF